MLISPPFLPTRGANATEDEWLDAAMVGGQPGEGAYPVSFNMGWHGGMHLTAPTENRQVLPVRAISDGVVAYVRQPTAPNRDMSHPLNYQGGWTSDGVVVVRHETDIGTGDAARVIFFSIYMHLSRIENGVALNQRVYRKNAIGDAGTIYGSAERKIHFEIILDDTNLQHLVGRASGELNTGANGRVDAVYGDIHVKLPSGARVYAAQPTGNTTQPTAAAVHTTSEDLYIGLKFWRGRLTATTFRADGTQVGDPVTGTGEDWAEYELYRNTGTIHDAYPANGRPVRSSLYELLRFGRIIHTDNETLNPANVPHWRQVRYNGGAGWVNLNATGTMKFSDADFPHWRGWTLVADDVLDRDSRCGSATIKRWLDTDGDQQITPAEYTARTDEQTIKPKLARAICKFPTEWEAATIEARWSWLRTRTAENPNALTGADFELLRAHITALCFWEQAALRVGDAAVPAMHWRIQPREFMRWCRRCDWLSVNELARCLPRTLGANTIGWGTAHQRAENAAEAIHLFFRKYLGADRQRQTHAMAQIYIETGLLDTMSEYSRGHRRSGDYPYGAFYGRGLMQLTWAKNYDNYGTYKGIPNQTGNPRFTDDRLNSRSNYVWADGEAAQRWGARYDPEIVASEPEHAGESAGFYWVSKTFRGTRNINRVCDLGLEGNKVGFVSWLVNGGGNGYNERQQYARYVGNVLLDNVPRTGTETWNFPPVGGALTGSFPPGNPAASSSVTVNYAPQIP